MFKKRDFVENAPLLIKSPANDKQDSDEQNIEDEKPIYDTTGEKLIHFKSSNLMNSMLPYAQSNNITS